MSSEILKHLGTVFITITTLWFFGGLLVDSVSKISKKLNQSGFTTAFFILGFLTSMSEISVMINSSIIHKPQISAGNITGASLMIFLCIIPFLAIMNKQGVTMKNTLSRYQLFLALIVVSLPTVFLMTGTISLVHGIVCILAYFTVFYSIERHSPIIDDYIDKVKTIVEQKTVLWIEIAKIIISAVVIFFAGDVLVNQANYVSQTLSVPGSLVGLVLLSVGTNIPELIVAIRAVIKNRSDIAFGGYISSALTNTLSFGFLVLINGTFVVITSQFLITTVVTLVGLLLFFIFSQSENKISRFEGLLLFTIYISFMVIQTMFLIGVLRY